MNRIYTAIIIAIVAIVPLFGTGISEEPSAGPVIQLQDALGRTVELPAAPDRIVAAGRAVLMVADAIYAFPGAGERLVGVGRIDQGRGNFLRALDGEYDTKTILERTVGPEQVAALRPDLVILKTFMRESLGSSLEQLEIPVLYVEFETPEQYQRDLLALGKAVGNEARARELQGYFAEGFDEIATRTADITGRPDTLFLYLQPGDTGLSFSVPAPSWIQTTLVSAAGGNPVWTEDVTGGGWIRVNLEQVLRWNPDTIVLVSYRNDVSAVLRELADDPVAGRLEAFRTGRVYPFPVDFYSWDQPDVRWLLGLKWLAATLHPDLFSDIDVRSEVYEFYATLYGMDAAETDRTIMSLLGNAVD